MKNAALFIACFFTLILPINAQSFSSGSTGADGALDLSTGPCNRQVQLPESGILNYTFITIPIGCSVGFRHNFRNTPVIILATGNIEIAGLLSVAAPHGTRVPGPGGFSGGDVNQAGFGPRGGATGGSSGQWFGSLDLVPPIGGSGGGGYSTGCCTFQGGGGGGAIVLASSTSIVISGQINANGNVGPGVSGGIPIGSSTGSGGAIRLVANSINVVGILNACDASGNNNCGVIRLEAPPGFLSFGGSGRPLPVLSTTINSQIVPGNSTPSLSIASVGGFPVAYTAGRPDVVDLILPNQVSDPINIVVNARNIPVGTQVTLNISGQAAGTFTPGTLSGTQASSTTVIGVSGLSRTGATYLIAAADFTLPANALKFNKDGPDQIAKVRVMARPGLDSKLIFLRKNGTEINLDNVPKAIQQQFGLK